MYGSFIYKIQEVLEIETVIGFEQCLHDSVAMHGIFHGFEAPAANAPQACGFRWNAKREHMQTCTFNTRPGMAGMGTMCKYIRIPYTVFLCSVSLHICCSQSNSVCLLRIEEIGFLGYSWIVDIQDCQSHASIVPPASCSAGLQAAAPGRTAPVLSTRKEAVKRTVEQFSFLAR